MKERGWDEYSKPSRTAARMQEPIEQPQVVRGSGRHSRVSEQRDKLGDYVIIQTTKTPPWERKKKRRAANKAARASKKRNR